MKLQVVRVRAHPLRARLAAAAVLGACSPKPPAGGGIDSAAADTAAPRAVELELGQGRAAFGPVDAGLLLVYGPQGGWHVEPALRVHGLSPDGLRLGWSGDDAATGAPLAYSVSAELSPRSVVPLADGGWDRVGDLLVFDVADDADVLGRPLRVRARLEEAAGGALVAEVALEAEVVCCG